MLAAVTYQKLREDRLVDYPGCYCWLAWYTSVSSAVRRSSIVPRRGLCADRNVFTRSSCRFSDSAKDFVDATAQVSIEEDVITVRFQRRAHNPLLLAADFAKSNVARPWLGNKRLQLAFG